MRPDGLTSTRARILALRFLTLLLGFAALLGFAENASAESCSGAAKGFEILDGGGDDESGIGGTGLGGSVERPSSSTDSTDPTGLADRRGAQARGSDDDSGLGGTGRAPRPAGDGDSGIGGTGIHGPVTRTDRLCVNGFSIEVPAQLALEGSGGTAAAHALSVGQIVFVEARRTEDSLVAKRIVLADDYAGQIEVIDGPRRSLVVSGQTVKLPAGVARGPGLGSGPLEAGQWIAVHGMPNERGELVATRLESARTGERRARNAGGVDQLAGWLRSARDLDYLSLEGFVTGTRAEPRVSGLALDFGAPEGRPGGGNPRTGAGSDRSAGKPDRLRPGLHVRVGGRVEGADTVHIALPPRPPTPNSPPRNSPPPRPEADTPAPPEPDVHPAPPSPPRRPQRPEDTTPRKPPVRPDVKRPTNLRPSIDRSTRRDFRVRR